MRSVLYGVLICFISIFIGHAQIRGTLLVVNKADTTVSILDLRKGIEVASIKTENGPHEVAISKSGKIGAVTNYGDMTPNNSLTIINIPSKSKTKVIDLDKYVRPHGIEFISNKELLVTSETLGVLLKVNIDTEEITELAVTEQKAGHMVAHAKNDKYAYVSNIVSGTVSKIDIENNLLVENINAKPGIEGIDITPNGKEIWVANRNDSTVMIIGAANYKQIKILPAHKVAFRIKVLPDSKFAIVSNGESGNLSIYDVQKKVWIKDISLQNVNAGVDKFQSKKADPEHPPVPVGLSVSNDSEYVFVACANYDLVAVINTQSWEVIKTIKTGKAPDGLYFSSYQYK